MVSQTINLEDTTPPMLTPPVTTTIECSDDATDLMLTGEAVVVDNCDIAASATFSDGVTPGSCPGQFTILRTFTATDDCGNTSLETQLINVVDTQAPEYAFFPADSTVECSSIVGGPDVLTVGLIADGLPAPVVTDNCSVGLMPTFTDAYVSALACPSVGVFTRNFDPVDDGCGNILPARTLTITIIDTLAPVLFGVPVAGDIDCAIGLPPLSNVSAEDCDPDVLLVATQEDDDDNSLGLGLPGVNGVVQVVTQTFTATDACGLTTVAAVPLRVLDFEEPVLVSCPADIGPIVARPDDRAAVDFPLPVFTDNCDFTLVGSAVSGDDFPVGLTTVDFVAIDGGGNRAFCSFTIEVVKALNIACTTTAISIDDPSDVTRADINFPYAETTCDLCPQGEDIDDLDYLGYWQGHHYYVSEPNVKLSPEAANDLALRMGGRLVQIDDSLENRFIQRELPYDDALIGLWAHAPQGDWRWTTDDNATDYRNWSGGSAPASTNGEQYAAIDGSSGEHFAVNVSQRPFIIEFSCIEFELIDVSATGTYGQGTGCILYAALDQCGNRDTCHYTFRVNTFPVNYCAPGPILFDEQLTEQYDITGVRIGAFAKTFQIGDSEYNLRDTIELDQDVATSISLQAATTGPDATSWPSYWRGWVDANGDGDFYEPGEMIYEGQGNAGVTDQLVLPASLATMSPTRLRVAVSRYTYPEPCGSNAFGSYKDFSITTDGTVALPRLALSGALNNRIPQLTTSSLEEPSIASYLLLRGASADDLTKIDRWQAVARDGARHTYTYDDSDPLLAAYYQAVSLNADGYILLRSNIVYLELPVRRGPVSLYPNPAKDRVIITTPEPVGDRPGSIALYDALGRVVRHGVWPAGAEKVELALPSLPTGAYHLRVTHEDLEPTPLRVIIDQSGSRSVPRA